MRLVGFPLQRDGDTLIFRDSRSQLYYWDAGIHVNVGTSLALLTIIALTFAMGSPSKTVVELLSYGRVSTAGR